MLNRKGFTLVELMIVMAIIAVIASIAVPNLLSARQSANESAAIATLRDVIAAQAQIHTQAAIDMDQDGIGEYGYFAELAGTVPLRAAPAAPAVTISPPLLSASLGLVDLNGYLDHDPGRLIRMAICGTLPPRILGREERDRLLDALSQAEGKEAKRDHALFHLMLGTGLRLGSALALERDDVDLQRGEIRIREAKGDRPDRIFLSRGVREHLQGFLVGRSDGPLFTGRNGDRLSHRHVQRRFSQWIEKAGIARSATVHSLRGTFASELYRRTNDVLLVKEALRHRSIASTLAYVRMDEDRLRRVLQG